MPFGKSNPGPGRPRRRKRRFPTPGTGPNRRYKALEMQAALKRRARQLSQSSQSFTEPSTPLTTQRSRDGAYLTHQDSPSSSDTTAMRPTQDSQSSSDTAMRHETSTPLRRQSRRGFTYSTRQESQSPSHSNTTMQPTQDSERSPTSVCETQLLQDSQDSQYRYSVSGSQHLQDSQDSQNSYSVSGSQPLQDSQDSQNSYTSIFGSQPLQEVHQLNVGTKVIVKWDADGRWYNAVIEVVNGDQTFGVLYDNKEREISVNRSKIQTIVEVARRLGIPYKNVLAQPLDPKLRCRVDLVRKFFNTRISAPLIFDGKELLLETMPLLQSYDENSKPCEIAYAKRLFEINAATMCATMCDICSRHDISDGVIQLSATCSSRRKFIYFDVTNDTYVYECRAKALQHDWRHVPSCCSCCRNYIIKHAKHAAVHKTDVPF